LASGYSLQKRGCKTGLTSGELLSVDVDGFTSEADPDSTPPSWALFGRSYTGAFTIKSSGSTAFSDSGDSGAAVVTKTATATDPDYNKIVGILFAGGGSETFATPICTIESAYSAYGLT